MTLELEPDAALVVVDVQKGFDDGGFWKHPNNPALEVNVERLLAAWTEASAPIVIVRHDSVDRGSTLRPGQVGNDLIDPVAAIVPDLLVVKSVNSSFLGSPDLAVWLRASGISQIVLCGISTNTCVETTARMGQNLGFDVLVAIDATRAFALTGSDGSTLTADQLTTASAVNLTASGFARVISTDEAASAMTPIPADGAVGSR